MATYKRDDLRRVFFSKLSEQCDEGIIHELCIQFGPIRNISWPTTTNLSGTPQRMSYCFVDFENPEDAKYCYLALHHANIKLFGAALQVSHASSEIAERESGAKVSSGRHTVFGLHEVGAKVLVRNVDVRVTMFDLTKYFESFGPFAVPPRMIRDSMGNFKGTVILSYKSFKSSDRAIKDMNGRVYRDRAITLQYALLEDGSGRLHGSLEERKNAELIQQEERRYMQTVKQETAGLREERQQHRAKDSSWAEDVDLYQRR